MTYYSLVVVGKVGSCDFYFVAFVSFRCEIPNQSIPSSEDISIPTFWYWKFWSFGAIKQLISLNASSALKVTNIDPLEGVGNISMVNYGSVMSTVVLVSGASWKDSQFPVASLYIFYNFYSLLLYRSGINVS